MSKITRAKWSGSMAQAVVDLLCKCEALSSNLRPPTKKKKSYSDNLVVPPKSLSSGSTRLAEHWAAPLLLRVPLRAVLENISGFFLLLLVALPPFTLSPLRKTWNFHVTDIYLPHYYSM
jgi:hypothetical protein